VSFTLLKQKIRGFLHLYNGQEAIPAGFTHAMDLTKDSMITAYRCHVHPMAMGVDPKRIMAELCGKARELHMVWEVLCTFSAKNTDFMEVTVL
jgi:TPP-dependent pyruvate/acetoin dehydrogenase alpha subunit